MYFFTGIVVFPAYVKKTIIRELTKTGTNDVSIERVSFNPCTFKIEITKFLFRNRTTGLLFSAETMALDFSPVSSLRSGMPVFTDLLLLDARLTYVKHSVLSPLFEFLRTFDWSVIPQFRLDRARVVNAGINYENVTLPKKFALRMETLDAELKDYVMHGTSVNSLVLDATTGDGEKVKILACFDLEPYGISGEAFFDDLRLVNYEPLMGLPGGYTIVDGLLSGRTLYDFEASPGDGKSRLSGFSAHLDSLSLGKTGEQREVLGFDRLSLDGAEVDFTEKTLAFDSVLMKQGLLVLDPFLPAATTESGRFRGDTKWDSISIGKSALRIGDGKYTIGPSILRNGSFFLSDEDVLPPVKLAVAGIDISVGEVISDKSRLSKFSVTAKIGEEGSLQMLGETNPFAISRLARFRLLAQNVSLVPFGPYTEKYLGYGLNDGDLKLDMNFLLQDRKLSVRNKLILNRVELGEKNAGGMESAVKLTTFPLPMAVALLEDMNGSIELDVPFEGTMADPGYDIGKALIDAVLRPFGFICRWLAGKDNNRYYLDFPAGSFAVSGQDTKKIDDVIKRLNESPGSVIDIEGSVDHLVDSGDLCLLAKSRAAAVKEYMVVMGAVDAKRIFVLDTPDGMVFVEGSRAYMYLTDPLTE